MWHMTCAHWPMAVSRCMVECLSFHTFLFLPYSQGSIAWSLENVWLPYSSILSPDPQAMIPDLNVNKQRNSTTCTRATYFTEIDYVCDMWHVTGYRWQVTGDRWHVTCCRGWTLFENFSTLALTFCIHDILKIWRKRMTQLMNQCTVQKLVAERTFLHIINLNKWHELHIQN